MCRYYVYKQNVEEKNQCKNIVIKTSISTSKGISTENSKVSLVGRVPWMGVILSNILKRKHKDNKGIDRTFTYTTLQICRVAILKIAYDTFNTHVQVLYCTGCTPVWKSLHYI